MDKQELILKDYLLETISDTKFYIEFKLPSEYQLVEQFQMSRIKVRNVYTLLEKMGLVYSKKGIGRFIKQKQKPLDVVMSGNISFSEKMKSQTANYKSKLTKFERVAQNHAIYTKIDIGQEPLYLVERLRYIDDEPAAIHRSYVVMSNMPEIKKIDSRLTSMYQFYQRFGVKEFRSTFSQLSVQYVNEIERNMLNCEVLVPIVKVESDNWDAERNVLLEYTEIIYRTDLFYFQI
ncbi:GntR family transcriptional regulator [Solibacillus sp. FSL W8-0474]|uniref:GntR family transcriptional regulator n=1 Tax=Solibacillus sp. FSL W8-0474 TaxID=2975336 RepID=UPI0030F574A2